MSDELQRILPRLSGEVSPKAEREIMNSFYRIYDFLSQLREEDSKISSDLQTKILAESQKTSALLNNFGTKLVQPKSDGTIDTLGNGTVTTFTVTDATIFSVSNPSTSPNLSLKVQNANKGLFGPTGGGDAVPTFRKLVVADADNNLWSLSKLDVKVLETDDNLTKTIVGAPYVNDGFVTIKDNNGHSIKLMTTA